MGRYSYLVVGTERAAELSLGSTGHGAGRALSRSQALKKYRPNESRAEMRRRGVEVMAASKRTLAEEMPEVYKDVSHVVESAVGAHEAVKDIAVIGIPDDKWGEAVKASRYDLASDPIFHNNSIFPCQKEPFSWEKVSYLKKLTQ